MYYFLSQNFRLDAKFENSLQEASFKSNLHIDIDDITCPEVEQFSHCIPCIVSSCHRTPLYHVSRTNLDTYDYQQEDVRRLLFSLERRIHISIDKISSLNEVNHMAMRVVHLLILIWVSKTQRVIAHKHLKIDSSIFFEFSN